MKYAWLVLGIFAARLFATAIAFPQVDGDISWQRWLGDVERTTHVIPRHLDTTAFAAVGSPWTPQEWLFSLAASYSRTGLAWDIFAASSALAAVAALGIGARLALRRGASPRAIAACTTLAGVAMLESFGVRVQVLAWPLLAAFLYLLELESPWAYAALGVAALWSNVHASAMLAPVIAGLAAAGAAIDERGFTPAVRRLSIISVGSLFALCCNPLGWDVPIYAISLFNSPIRHVIREWAPAQLGDTSFVAGSFPLLVLALLYFADNDRRRFRDVFILATFAFLSLSAARNIAIFGIVGLAYIAPALTRSTRIFAQDPTAVDPRLERIGRFAMPGLACLLAIVVAAGLLSRSNRVVDNVGQHAVASIAKLPGDKRVFCSNFSWCSLALGLPHVSVFLDGRADPYPLPIWDDALRIVRPDADWKSIIEKRRINTLVVKRESPLDEVVARTPNWRQSYNDDYYRVWVLSSERVRPVARTNSVAHHSRAASDS